MNAGRLELILGPMFSGKSAELIRIINRYECIKKNILTITHTIDNRYGNGVISSHNRIQKKSISVENLFTILETDEYKESEIIIVEEGQFFQDLKKFVVRAIDIDNKHVIVAGLSGDFRREPFGQILELIPLAEQITKLSAFCKLCNDGTPGDFTKRIEKDSTEQTLVGNDNYYLAVCRKHYLMANI
jgi:thymidine kinase